MDHIQGKGEEVVSAACREDLEGIVAKWVHGLCDAQGVSSSIKIKNPASTHIAGREELFERKKLNGTEASGKTASERKAAVGSRTGSGHESAGNPEQLGWQPARTRQRWERTTQATSNDGCGGKSADRCSESKVG